ncbi:conserved hypothetical protein [Culex quinquefasciatus]|uniref:CCHC-type domain-containing protein n=1 Tax=Culex quinquefasciatus TaxID=7176 RepID=B0WDT5_CULQU|nr:conserved hypothetical protein [Culex quinquefasciatus]|eukprot:XP_001846869.1 conserved hypothetical protein [Culex quinquefasciatus]
MTHDRRYGDHFEEEIKEQLFEKGASDDLRAKILNKPEMTLAETVEAGRLVVIGSWIHKREAYFGVPTRLPVATELPAGAQLCPSDPDEILSRFRPGHQKMVHHQTQHPPWLSPRLEEVNKIAQTATGSKNNPRRECFRCGRTGHYANDENCPALDRKCERCGLVGHFKKRCNTKKKKKVSDKGLRQVMMDLKVDDSDGSDDLEEDKLNYVYSLTPHPTTGRSPAELAFGRRFKDWIPQLVARDLRSDEAVRDQDLSYRTAAKKQYDKAHNVKKSTITEGDQVLMRNFVKQNKLSTAFLPQPVKVIKKEGNSVLLETPDGVQYRRNSSHVKCIPRSPETARSDTEEEDENSDELWATPEASVPMSTRAEKQKLANGRPRRQIKRPLRYDDYITDLNEDK